MLKKNKKKKNRYSYNVRPLIITIKAIVSSACGVCNSRMEFRGRSVGLLLFIIRRSATFKSHSCQYKPSLPSSLPVVVVLVVVLFQTNVGERKRYGYRRWKNTIVFSFFTLSPHFHGQLYI